jgi:1,4-dihydroxy-2-naphthoyl-CoA hydrolase
VTNPLLASQPRERWAATIADVARSGLAGLLGIQVVELREGHAETALALRDDLMLFAGGPIHAGTVFGLADTCAGWGCLVSLPDTAEGFTTIEGKTNFLTSARAPDRLDCVATMIHSGRTTQVWDAVVRRESDGREVGVYRCTQALLASRRS